MIQSPPLNKPFAGMNFVVLSVPTTQAKGWAGSRKKAEIHHAAQESYCWQAESHKPQQAAAEGKGHLSWLENVSQPFSATGFPAKQHCFSSTRHSPNPNTPWREVTDLFILVSVTMRARLPTPVPPRYHKFLWSCCNPEAQGDLLSSPLLATALEETLEEFLQEWYPFS